MSSHRCVHVSLLLAAALAAGPLRAQKLLVVNQGDATISVIDPSRMTVVTRIAEGVKGVHAHEIAVSSDGTKAFAPVYGSAGVGRPGIDGQQVLVVDVASGRVASRISLPRAVRPHFPVIDPTRHLLYITTELGKSVTVLDERTGVILGEVPTGAEQSHMLAVSHDGTRGYTANVSPGSVSVLDLVARKTLAVIPVASTVQRIALSADDRQVFTADQTRPELVVIDTATNRISNRIALPSTGYGAAATRDGKWLLIALPHTNEVAVVDLAAGAVVRRIKVAAAPQEVLIRPDGKFAYVSCTVAGTVDAIDLGSWAVVKSLAAGPFADGMAWVP